MANNPTGKNIYDVYRQNSTLSAKTVEYRECLRKAQEYVSDKHSDLLVVDINQAILKELHEVISKYIVAEDVVVGDMSVEELADKIVSDMAGYSFIEKYLAMPGVEEININSYDHIEVIMSGGRSEVIPETFISPEQGLDIIRRMLLKCGMTIDDTMPSVLGYLDKNVRIAVNKPPVVDDECGINASIRIVNQSAVTREKLIGYGSATPEMMDFLEACIKNGVSVCFAGATGSGKTTLMAWMLSQTPNNRRLITIEEGSRELNCIKKDADGNIINSVVHMLTRPHEDPTMHIDQDLLLERALRMNPDIIGVGEMRSYEAMTAAEASRTGHTVATTIHSNSAAASYRRMMTLAKKKYSSMDDRLLMQIMLEAFPVIVYTKQLADGSRHIMEIIEGEDFVNDKVKYRTLYRFDISDNIYDADGELSKIIGKHTKKEIISDRLKNIFIDNGLSMRQLKEFITDGTTEESEVEGE